MNMLEQLPELPLFGNEPETNPENVIKQLLITTPNFVNSELGVEIANVLLPRSTGMEFECFLKEDTPIRVFKKIPNIMEADVDIGQSEHRFRIPPGLKGFKCLFAIGQLMCTYGIPSDSGHHYHIDMTDIYSQLNAFFIADQEKWILEELDSWEYKGSYNRREVKFDCSASWVRFQYSFKTMECRIGEMTFDYQVLIKRILHLQEIAERIKHELDNYASPEQLRKQLKPELEELDLDEVRRIVNNRMI